MPRKKVKITFAKLIQVAFVVRSGIESAADVWVAAQASDSHKGGKVSELEWLEILDASWVAIKPQVAELLADV